jgi:hypothetical protein
MKVVHHHGEHGLNGVNVQKCKKADDPNQGFGRLNAVAQEKQAKSVGGHVKILGAVAQGPVAVRRPHERLGNSLTRIK